MYFNPRSPHGERPAYIRAFDRMVEFQSTLPARGATSASTAGDGHTSHFNPRSPHGERLSPASRRSDLCAFQSTLPARGATVPAACASASTAGISIHAPRTGSDCRGTKRFIRLCHFNPRSPHGERQTRLDGHDRAIQFQSTLPARGASTPPRPRCRCCCHFNPRSPHGERQSITVTIAVEIHISTHAPRTGSDSL